MPEATFSGPIPEPETGFKKAIRETAESNSFPFDNSETWDRMRPYLLAQALLLRSGEPFHELPKEQQFTVRT